MTTLDTERPAFFRLRIRPYGLVTAAGAVACVATVFGFCGRLAWFLDLFSHFRVQYFLALFMIAAAALALRQRKAAAVFGVFALVNACVIAPLYFGASPRADSSAPRFRAVLLNVNTEHGDAERVAAFLQSVDPDVIVLEEVSEGWLADLGPALEAWPYSCREPREDNFGIALYSRLPFTKAEVVYVCEPDVPTVVADIDAGDAGFTVIATHPVPPANAAYARWRNDQLGALPALVESAASPVLLLGDLNVTPWSHHFRRLLKRSGLRDSARGHGVQATWPSHLVPLRIPIDHGLHADAIGIVDRTVGAPVGSDHLPLIVDFAVPSGRARGQADARAG
ncbi:MAG: endonuclease/exonuclease/phosphatase family protein [Candidatus Hydrogenedentes bacterium]|nr:endonuclease/exonuclease/phosphatase family protein [Candidatus Hydrogenedentota bacterium]